MWSNPTEFPQLRPMSPAQVERLNIGLLVAAALVAYALPFSTFLFAYAVLGPLHYFTEVQWLHQRGYFVKHPGVWPWVLGGTAVLLSLYPLFRGTAFGDELGSYLVFRYPEFWVLWALWVAVGMVLFPTRQRRGFWALVGAAVCAGITLLFPNTSIALKVLIPTVVHVYLFTLLFMVFGQLKSRSVNGWIAVGLMVAVPGVLLLWPEVFLFFDGRERQYWQTDLRMTNLTLEQLLGAAPVGSNTLTRKVQFFLAFAYTYHYLNWFSKTTLIGWGQTLTKRNTVIIAVLWVASIALYLWDYAFGLRVLFFVSFLHVVLEFPLNARTALALWPSSRQRFR